MPIIMIMMVFSYVTIWDVNNIKYFAIILSLIGMYFKGSITLERNKIFFYSLLMFIFIVSTLFQPISISQKILAIGFYVVLLSWLLFGYKLITTPNTFLRMAEVMLIAVAVVLFFSVDLINSQLGNIYNIRRRVWGGFTHANTLGSICVSGIMFIICYLVLDNYKSFERRKKMLILILLSMFLAVLFITKSRTSLAMLIVFVGIVCLPVLKRFEKHSRIISIFTGIVVVIILSYLFLSEYALNDQAFILRLNSFNHSSSSLYSFMFGMGMVDARTVQNSMLSRNSLEIAWVMIFYKNGLIGLITYLLLFIYTAFAVKKKSLPPKQKVLFWATYFSMLIGSFGEAYIINITNVISMVQFLLLSVFANNSICENHRGISL